ncbi:hypothetical protein MKX03_029599 [Papaver bracteatum]|nr:hypothetical protein MKX03_029599 [Papaver bracteatum]
MDCSREKTEVTAISMDPYFSLICTVTSSQFFLTGRRGMIFSHRNKRKYARGEEIYGAYNAMDGVRVVNGLEYKISCVTSKVYIIHTPSGCSLDFVLKFRTI